jgi:hypothetical protein
VYRTATGELDEKFMQNSWLRGQAGAVFTGNGIGLHVDEPPVIAEGCSTNRSRRTCSLPWNRRKATRASASSGVEDTYVVEKGGAGASPAAACDIIEVN